MINNTNPNVADMRWTPDGQRICIVYADGLVIVGAVTGNRVWGKNISKKLCLVEWSPTGHLLLFGTRKGEVHVHEPSVRLSCVWVVGGVGGVGRVGCVFKLIPAG